MHSHKVLMRVSTWWRCRGTLTNPCPHVARRTGLSPALQNLPCPFGGYRQRLLRLLSRSFTTTCGLVGPVVWQHYPASNDQESALWLAANAVSCSPVSHWVPHGRPGAVWRCRPITDPVCRPAARMSAGPGINNPATEAPAAPTEVRGGAASDRTLVMGPRRDPRMNYSTPERVMACSVWH